MTACRAGSADLIGFAEAAEPTPGPGVVQHVPGPWAMGYNCDDSRFPMRRFMSSVVIKIQADRRLQIPAGESR